MHNQSMGFEMARTPALTCRAGALGSLPKRLAELGWRRIAVVTGGRSVRSREQWAVFCETLLEVGVEFVDFTVRGEPSPEVVDGIVAEIRRQRDACQAVVGIGGGSVMDAAKAAAAMLGERHSVVEFLEGVGTREPSGTTVPCVAVPTTAGTGSEATKNAVISHVGPGGFKKSLRHDNFIPVWAIIDAELHLDCPMDVTRASGLDAVSQLIESYLSSKSVLPTDAWCEQGLAAAGSVYAALAAGDNSLAARESMAYAAFLSGVGLANAGLGAIHGLASPIGAAADIPHGVVCGRLLGPLMRVSLTRLRRDPQSARGRSSAALWTRLARVAALVLDGGTAGALAAAEKAPEGAAERLVAQLERWAESLPRLGTFGLAEADQPRFAREGGIKNHPVALDESELIAAMRAAW